MLFLKRTLPYIFLLFISTLFVFILIGQHVLDADTWYHIKIGEVFSHHGLFFRDIFSNYAREWTPFEWLFQIALYTYVSFAGIASLSYFVLLLTALQLCFIYFFIRRLFTLSAVFSIAMSMLFLQLNLPFFTARPQLFELMFFSIALSLLLLYYIKSKNFLWISLPLFFIWVNTNASVVLGVAFFWLYTVTCFLQFILTKDKKWFHKTRVLGLFTVAITLISFTPPIGLLQYKEIATYIIHRDIMSQFIFEWFPLYSTPERFYPYIAACLLVLIPFSILSIKKGIKTILWTIPVIILICFGFGSLRNAIYGYFGLVLLGAWTYSQLVPTLKKLCTFGLIALTVLLFTVQLTQNIQTQQQPLLSLYPVRAAQFIKTNHLRGHMFNEYSYGGYLIYSLYPTQKVFLSGLADPYLCCELPDANKLYTGKFLPDNQYRTILHNLWNKYDISFALIKTRKNTYTTKISNILLADPSWSLVYWDDTFEIFVRRDGKNKDIIQKYGAHAATPYGLTPYKKGMEIDALREYERMIAYADSAHSRNAIGLLLWQEKRYDQAQRAFEKAILIDPSLDSPYINLALIYTQQKDYVAAIHLYQMAIGLSPERTFLYISLGKLYALTQNTQAARDIWNQGLQAANSQTDKDRIELQRLLNSY